MAKETLVITKQRNRGAVDAYIQLVARLRLRKTTSSQFAEKLSPL